MRKRRCTACGETKPRGEFYRDRCLPAGYHSTCKVCFRVDVNARRRRRLAEDEAGFRARQRAASCRYATSVKGRAAGARRTRRHRSLTRLPADAEERRRILEYGEAVRTAKKIHCAFCGRRIPKPDRRVAHVVPVSRGGAHVRSNLTCACARCTASRASRPVRLPAGMEDGI